MIRPTVQNKIFKYLNFIICYNCVINYYKITQQARHSKSVFLNRRAAARYRALATILPGRERPEEITVCYKI